MRLKFLIVLCLILTVGKAQNADSLVIQFLEERHIGISDDNQITLLKTGRDKFNDLFEHIRQARHHIHMEYFNFRNDSIGAEVSHLLKQKVEEGVEVRVLFDAFGNSSNDRPLKKKHLKALREDGIDIVKFDPMRFPYINHAYHRDHRKIVVIDGKVGYTGGMNVADYYIHGLPNIGDWHDMHMRIEGSAVHDLQDIFLDMWKKATKQKIEGEEYYPEMTERKGDKVVAIVDRKPLVTPKDIRQTYMESIRQAEEKVQIISPYFTPTKPIRRELKKAAKRGVDLQIMISEKSDIPFTPDAVFYFTHKLMKQGATIHIYRGGFHHTKIMMVDDSFCTVGSANLNSRSLYYDYEANAFIFNQETTRELIELFEGEKEHCVVMTPEYWKKRSGWKKFVGWFAHLFTPFI